MTSNLYDYLIASGRSSAVGKNSEARKTLAKAAGISNYQGLAEQNMKLHKYLISQDAQHPGIPEAAQIILGQLARGELDNRKPSQTTSPSGRNPISFSQTIRNQGQNKAAGKSSSNPVATNTVPAKKSSTVPTMKSIVPDYEKYYLYQNNPHLTNQSNNESTVKSTPHFTSDEGRYPQQLSQFKVFSNDRMTRDNARSNLSDAVNVGLVGASILDFGLTAPGMLKNIKGLSGLLKNPALDEGVLSAFAKNPIGAGAKVGLDAAVSAREMAAERYAIQQSLKDLGKRQMVRSMADDISTVHPWGFNPELGIGALKNVTHFQEGGSLYDNTPWYKTHNQGQTPQYNQPLLGFNGAKPIPMNLNDSVTYRSAFNQALNGKELPVNLPMSGYKVRPDLDPNTIGPDESLLKRLFTTGKIRKPAQVQLTPRQDYNIWQTTKTAYKDADSQMFQDGGEVNPLDDFLSQMKAGGFHLNPRHKGWCTPMSKSTCTGKRRQFAINAKNHFK